MGLNISKLLSLARILNYIEKTERFLDITKYIT